MHDNRETVNNEDKCRDTLGNEYIDPEHQHEHGKIKQIIELWYTACIHMHVFPIFSSASLGSYKICNDAL